MGSARISRRVLFQIATLLAGGAVAFPVYAGVQPISPRVRLILRGFQHQADSARQDTISQLLPGLLQAALLRYNWLEVVAVQAPAEGGLQQPGSAAPAKSGADVATFSAEGSLVLVKGNIRLDLSAVDVSDGSMVFSGFAMFSENNVLTEVGALAGRLAAALAPKVGAAESDQLTLAVVSPFRCSGDPGKLQALSTLIPDVLATLLAREQPAGVQPREVFQAPDPKAFDATLTASYAAGSDGLTISVLLSERSGAAVRFSFTVAADEPLEIPDILARRVSELLRGRITETGAWRPEPLLTASNAGYAEFTTQAERYFSARDFLPAVVLYRKAIFVQPQEPAPRYRLAEIYLTQKDYAAAIREFQEVLRIAPKSARAMYGMGNVYLAQGKNTPAADAFSKALELAPADQTIALGAYKGLGDLELLEGKYDAAILNYTRAQNIAEAASSPDLEVYRSIGKAHRAAGHMEQAIASLAAAVKRFPSNAALKDELASAYNALGDDLIGKGTYDKSRDAFRAALDAVPGSAPVRARAIGGLGYCMAVSGSGGGPKAIEYLQQAVALDPQSELYQRVLAWTYINREPYQFDKGIESLKKALAIDRTYESLWLLGNVYRRNRQYDLAEESLLDALRLRPGSYESQVELAQVYLATKKTGLAIEKLNAAISLDAGQESAYRGMAEVKASLQDYPHAVENQKTAARIAPSAYNYYMLASYLRKNKDDASALEALRQSLRIDPNYSYAYSEFRAVCEATAQLKEYVKLLEDAVRANASTGSLHTLLGQAYYDSGRYDQAASELKKAISLTPEDGEAWHVLALAYRKKGDTISAVDALRHAIQAAKETASLYRELSAVYSERGEGPKYLEFLVEMAALNPKSLTAHVKLGDEYRLRGKLDQAVKVLREATLINPQSEWAQRVLGAAYQDQSEYEKALEALETANRLDPTQWSFYSIAQVRQSQGERDKALENYDRAIEKDDQYSYAYIGKASVLFDQKKTASAIAVLEGAAQKLPRDSEIRAQLGWYYQLAHENEKAEAASRAALAIDAKSSVGYYVLARIQNSRKEYQQALENLQAAIRYQPDFAHPYVLMRDIYHAQGKDAEGAKALRQYLDDSPENQSILDALGFLEQEYLHDMPTAYTYYERLYRLNPQLLNAKEDFAEANLTTGRFDRALELANATLSDRRLTPEEKLSLNLISIAANLLRGNRGTAFSEVSEFIRYYKSIPQDYEHNWMYQGIKTYLSDQNSLAPAERDLLLTLIGLLESPRPEGAQKVVQLEASLEQRFRDLR